jgi:bacteriorhodopsin
MSLYLDYNQKQVPNQHFSAGNQDNHNDKNNKNTKQKSTKNTDVTKDGKLDAVKMSFTLTYVLLLTTSLVTFIEAMRAQNPLIRHIFNLETAVSLVGGYFYSVFVGMIDDFKKRNVPFDWDAITKIRYLDWSITTPLMLLSLCLVLAKESKKIGSGRWVADRGGNCTRRRW